MSRDAYITLITSLPYAGELFAVSQTPISRIQLEARLSFLTPEDATQLQAIEGLLWWSSHSHEASDAEIAVKTKRLLGELENEWLRQLIRQRMEFRTLVAALRRRRRGESAADLNADWGFGRWLGVIHRNWSEPGFSLERAFPWVLEANRLLREEDHLGLERLLLGEQWRTLDQQGEGHYFDFEAVVAYVLKWGIMERWSSYHGEGAVRRFENVLDDAVGEYVQMFA
ncbi:MAG: hypothetical protein DIZ78_17305 [endosymbiont of Escarpia spicata]|uniref:DUF2764 domain-containing protein n=1 Tax=endosymbiont of Escarpia spicata TaxID=2200908 RepID=A0A370DBB7_9GAMM|nr:MAG: hypothetical protein DIZ78_17305 [endosymbiont of Escarpia spicata]